MEYHHIATKSNNTRGFRVYWTDCTSWYQWKYGLIVSICYAWCRKYTRQRNIGIICDWICLRDIHFIRRNYIRWTNNFSWRTSCQGTVSKLYARKDQLVLGEKKSATSSYCSNTIYCAYVYWLCVIKICSLYSWNYFQQKQHKLGFAEISYMSDWLWSWLYTWINWT